jgi:hypothetical protein
MTGGGAGEERLVLGLDDGSGDVTAPDRKVLGHRGRAQRWRVREVDGHRLPSRGAARRCKTWNILFTPRAPSKLLPSQ